MARIHCAAALVAYVGIFPPEAPKPTPASLLDGWNELIEDPGTEVGVAEAAGSLAGSVAVAPSLEVPTGLVLARLYVAPDRWGAGIGSLLHDWALDAARQRGASGLNLWVLEANERARRMYERRGWHLVPGPTVPNGDPTVVDVLYQRDL